MKKNVMMRVASALLVAVLLTTCAISGTFAKYTTSASGTDTARVAKWGVGISIASGTGFSNEYTKNDTAYSGTLSVKSEDDAKVVAPGTSSEQVSGDVTFAITGKPEVEVKVDINFNATSEIKLAAGTYNDYTTADDTTDEFTLSDDYYPVKFTLTKTGETSPVVDDGKLSDIATYLNGQTKYYDPGTDLAATYTLTWKWDFNGNDKADTYLANETDLQKLAYDLSITVTQVD